MKPHNITIKSFLCFAILALFSQAATAYDYTTEPLYDFTADGGYYKVNEDRESVTFMYEEERWSVVSPEWYSGGYNIKRYNKPILIPKQVEDKGKTYTVSRIENVLYPDGTYGPFWSNDHLPLLEIVADVPDVMCWKCPELLRLSVPASVASGSLKVTDCPKLERIYCLGTEPDEFAKVDITGLPDGCKLYVPAGSVEKYRASEKWGMFDDENILPYSEPERIEMQSAMTMTGGEERKLEAIVSPDDTYCLIPQYTSSDPSVASVDHTGVVRGLSAGTAEITAACPHGSGVSAKCVVTVRGVNKIVLPEEVEYIMPSPVIEPEQYVTLDFSVEPQSETAPKVTVSSSDPEVAQTSASNNTGTIKLKVLKPGKTVITVTANDDSGISASCVLNVVPKPITKITIPEQMIMPWKCRMRGKYNVSNSNYPDGCFELFYEPADSYGMPELSSSDRDLLAVTRLGQKGREWFTISTDGTKSKEGEAIITAYDSEYPDFKQECKVSVQYVPVQRYEIDWSELDEALSRHSNPIQINIKAYPYYSSTESLCFTSSDPNVVMFVDSDNIIWDSYKNALWKSSSETFVGPDVYRYTTIMFATGEPGAATITVSNDDGHYSETHDVCIESSGVDDILSPSISIHSEPGTIIADAGDGAFIEVFTPSGALVYRGNNTRVEVPAGTYIVRANGKSEKVIVR